MSNSQGMSVLKHFDIPEHLCRLNKILCHGWIAVYSVANGSKLIAKRNQKPLDSAFEGFICGAS